MVEISPVKVKVAQRQQSQSQDQATQMYGNKKLFFVVVVVFLDQR
jgi:hypothetical protein